MADHTGPEPELARTRDRTRDVCLDADPESVVGAALYRSVLASMQEGVVVQGLDGAIISCNLAAETILGLTRAQMSGRSSMDPRWRSVHEDGTPFDGAAHPAMMTLADRKPRRDVVMGVHKPSGEQAWISINSEPLTGCGGEHSGVVSTFIDISERRQHSLARERSEAHLLLALGAARMGTWEWDVGSGEVVWSPEVAGLFGLEQGAFNGTLEGFVALILPEDRVNMASKIQGALTRGAEERFETDFRTHLPDGRVRWLRTYGRVRATSDGRAAGMRGTVVDVTDQRRLEAQGHEARTMESIGRLAGGIAHDFNNLMSVVLGACELAAVGVVNGSDITGHLGVIRQGAERGGALTQQLLAFARRQRLEVERVAVDAVLEELRPLLQRVLGSSLELRLETRSGAVVLADRSQLEQVVINLLVNARDAMPNGGEIAVRTAVVLIGSDEPTGRRKQGRYVRIDVIDDGVGMAPGEVLRACEPFYTTKDTGTGLGLATCYGIVHQMMGDLEISSRQGRGTKVTVWLPLAMDLA